MWYTEKIKNHQPLLALAPMADMTDSPFCRIIKEISGCDVIFREMVSAEAVVRDNIKTLAMVKFHDSERPIVHQIFGANPETMAKAAAIIIKLTQTDGLDINMGCPVPKINKTGSGAALLKNPEKAGQIVRAVKKVCRDIPLSVKIRLGWDNADDYQTLMPLLERAGADVITVHGRTRAQGYNEPANWEKIAHAKTLVRIPVIANGDILDPVDINRVLSQTLADGVMIGRGVLGNPWFFKKYADSDFQISLEDRIKVIFRHLTLHLQHYGEKSIVTFRKHLAWYFKGSRMDNLPRIKEYRAQMMAVNSPEDLQLIFKKMSAIE